MENNDDQANERDTVRLIANTFKDPSQFDFFFFPISEYANLNLNRREWAFSEY